MSQLTVRCFGGFEVRLGDRQLSDFESLRVKALLADLVVHRRRTFSREHLAALLWPDRPEQAARRNLRQALYNLKSVVAGGDAGSPLRTVGGELGFDPGFDCWLDVDAFADGRRRGIAGGTVVPHYLTAAVALYRGDFLAGFALKGSSEFEFWQLAEQERLRDQAVDALRLLIDSYLSRGEFRLGIQYARRLVAIDPVSERARRYLMRLYSLAGHRGRALAEYERLRETLNRELGVEPLEETREVYEQLLKEQAPEPAQEDSKGIGPLIPLVGRGDTYRELRRLWQSVLEGRCRLTVVEGEPGIGKTRLVKSFLDSAGSQRVITILKGRCSERMPTAFQPLTQALRNAVTEDSGRTSRALESCDEELLATLALVVPEVRDLRPGLPPACALEGPTDRRRLFECFASFFEQLCRSAADGPHDEPLVLMLDDLHRAPRETHELISFLLERLAEVPVWILATANPGALGAETGTPATRVVLERLAPEAVAELAAALIGDDQATELAGLLIREGDGLPIAVAEWINSLWDEGILVYDGGRWHLRESLAERSGDLAELVGRRLRRLPTSTRRLASQAAVIGRKFDARLLTEAAAEHPQVVEVGLELMLERWLLRQHSDHWMSGRRERDIVLWAKGARLGRFEFSHHLIWQAILDDINPLRRQIMHRQVFEVLEAKLGDEAERFCELLAFHGVEAGAWDRAVVHLLRASRKALAVMATDTARHFLRRTVAVLDRLVGGARGRDAESWRQERERVVAQLEELGP